MNRKIYFDDKFIEFIEPGSQTSQNQDINSVSSVQSLKELKSALDNFLGSTKNKGIVVQAIDFQEALDLLKKQFYYIEAAGGFIEKDGDFLFIRRHNRWDLPKGKLEKKEKIKDAAIRECEEECGIQQLSILKQLPSTFHIYAYKDGFALKQSYWFHMQSDYSGTLTPQLEEDITEVKWFGLQEIKDVVLKDTYFTIRDVVVHGLGD